MKTLKDVAIGDSAIVKRLSGEGALKRRIMDLEDLIKGLYENFTLGRLPERQFNRLMTEYDTEQSNL